MLRECYRIVNKFNIKVIRVNGQAKNLTLDKPEEILVSYEKTNLNGRKRGNR
jgi:hypothetical protein